MFVGLQKLFICQILRDVFLDNLILEKPIRFTSLQQDAKVKDKKEETKTSQIHIHAILEYLFKIISYSHRRIYRYETSHTLQFAAWKTNY